jgi:hypothetical protein
MALDVKPELERRLRERVARDGISMDAFLARAVEDHPVTLLPRVPGGAETPSQVLFRKWAEEDAALSDAEAQEEEEFWEEFQLALNRERAAAGMRPIF